MKSFKFIPLVIFGVGNLVALYANGQSTLTTKIDSLINEYYSRDQFSGTVLISRDSKTIYLKSFGGANAKGNIKNQNTTRYDIGSIGKVFTATLILKQVELGRLKLTDSLKHLLPEYHFYNGDKITVKDLLSHTSGIGNYMSPMYDKEKAKIKSIDSVIPFILNSPEFVNKPYGNYNYSNSGYIILGKILEQILKTDYGSIVTNQIFIPLGMRQTGSYCFINNNASGYAIDNLNRKIYDSTEKSCVNFSDGGVYSTVEDMHKFDNALFSGKILNENSMQLMQTPVDPIAEYGLGLETDKYFGIQGYGHNGSTPYSKSDYRRFPSVKTTIIFLANTSNLVSRELSKNILAVLTNHEIIPPKIKLEIYLAKVLDEKGSSYVKEKFETLINSFGYVINSDNLLNGFGYDLMNANRVDDAVVIFTINTILFPNIANTYDSLAEAYLKNGDKEKSDLYYKKALQIARIIKTRNKYSYDRNNKLFWEKSEEVYNVL